VIRDATCKGGEIQSTASAYPGRHADLWLSYLVRREADKA